MINLIIDGIPVEAAEDATILEAAAAAGVEIPTLCYLKDVSSIGSCRMCVVEIEGTDRMVTACNTKVKEGMTVSTKSERVLSARRTVLDLLLADHHQDCFSCGKNGACELQKYCNEYGVEHSSITPQAGCLRGCEEQPSISQLSSGALHPLSALCQYL